MARPKEFVIEEALEAAMQAFWERGYTATSLSDLTQAMHVQKASLYGTFGDKHQLFLSALTRYQDASFDMIQSIIETPETAREKLELLMAWVYEGKAFEQKGCMCVNAQVELAPHDSQVTERLEWHFQRVADLITGVFKTGIENGEFRADLDPQVAASLYMTSMCGMFVASKSLADWMKLREASDLLLRSFLARS